MKDKISKLRHSFKKKSTVPVEDTQRPFYIQRLLALAQSHSYEEFLLAELTNQNLITLFSQNVDFHELYCKDVFDKYRYYKTIDDLEEDGLDFSNFLTASYKTVFETKGAILMNDTINNKLVLGLLIPTFYIEDEYDEVVFIGSSIYNYIVGKGKKLIFSDNENISFENILQTMENENIDDLHMGMIDEYRYFVSARINQKIISLQEKPLLQSAFKELYREALKLIGSDDENVPEIRGMISKQVINKYGRSIMRTYRFASMRTDKLLATGRSISVRRLKNKEEILSLGLRGLGYDDRARTMLKSVANMDGGLVLVTGATNSGKSTLMSTLLGEVNRRTFSIEDPIEILMDRENYIQIDLSSTETAQEKYKMTIPKAVKAVLRQDPTIIVLGEVRDRQEDEMFVDLGVKGHLALTTMHTDSVYSTLLRLSKSVDNMDEVTANIRLIYSGKLISKKCQACNGEGIDCSECKNTGASGMLPLFEMAKFIKLDVESDSIFNIKELIEKGKVDFYSKRVLAEEYKKKNLIFDEDYEKALEESIY